MKLRTSQWTAEHPTHGTFFVTQLIDGGVYLVQRIYAPAGEKRRTSCDRIAESETLYAAADAIIQRIHELDQDALVVEPPVTIVIPEAP